MKAEIVWQNKMKFEARVGEHKILMDANPPFGDGSQPTPKQLLLTSMAGCSAMDVASLLKKYKQEIHTFEVKIEAESVTTQPQIFKESVLEYFVTGPAEAAVLKEAISLSLSKYCSVSAMVSKVVPMRWKAYLNAELVGEGQAEFQL